MKVTVWARTDRVGSKMERVITVDDEDARNEDGSLNVANLDEAAHEEVMQMIEWGYTTEEG